MNKKINVNFSNSNKLVEDVFWRGLEFVSMFNEYGIPPDKEVKKGGNILQELIEKFYEEFFKSSVVKDFPFLDTKVFYKGKQNKNGRPTYYFISQR